MSGCSSFQRKLIAELGASPIKDLVKKLSREAIEADIVMLAVPYLRTITGEVLLHFIGPQPKDVPESSIFYQEKHQELMHSAATDLKRNARGLKASFARCVVGGNQGSDAQTLTDLNARVVEARKMFERHPQLLQDCPDEYYILSNSTVLQETR